MRRSSLTSVSGELHGLIMKKGDKPKAYPLSGIVYDAYVRWFEASKHSMSFQRTAISSSSIREQAGTSRGSLCWRESSGSGCSPGLPAEVVGVLSPHKLRHARARAMLRDGWDIAAVQSVLDHASIQTTQIYVGAPEAARLDALRTLNDFQPAWRSATE